MLSSREFLKLWYPQHGFSILTVRQRAYYKISHMFSIAFSKSAIVGCKSFSKPMAREARTENDYGSQSSMVSANGTANFPFN